jgi:hypothetical protein
MEESQAALGASSALRAGGLRFVQSLTWAAFCHSSYPDPAVKAGQFAIIHNLVGSGFAFEVVVVAGQLR